EGETSARARRPLVCMPRARSAFGRGVFFRGSAAPAPHCRRGSRAHSRVQLAAVRDTKPRPVSQTAALPLLPRPVPRDFVQVGVPMKCALLARAAGANVSPAHASADTAMLSCEAFAFAFSYVCRARAASA